MEVLLMAEDLGRCCGCTAHLTKDPVKYCLTGCGLNPEAIDRSVKAFNKEFGPIQLPLERFSQ
jgi:hypothetical protein